MERKIDEKGGEPLTAHLGKLIGSYNRRNFEAVLNDDGIWQCSNELIGRLLNRGYSLKSRRYGSPSAGSRGYAALQDAASEFDGEFEYLVDETETPESENIVY